jgi:hypothetical protein
MKEAEAQALQQVALNFLAKQHKMTLAINDASGGPNISVMHYAVGRDTLEMHFGTCRSYKKYPLLQANNHVSCIVLEEGPDPVRAISIHGIAHELNGVEYGLSFNLFKSSNRSKWYLDHKPDVVMFVIRPTSIHMLDGSSGELITTTIPLSI